MKEKDFTCQTCGKDFTAKHHLKAHVLTVHEGRKDFTCSFCGKGFTRNSTLKKHKCVHEVKKEETDDILHVEIKEEFNSEYISDKSEGKNLMDTNEGDVHESKNDDIAHIVIKE